MRRLFFCWQNSLFFFQTIANIKKISNRAAGREGRARSRLEPEEPLAPARLGRLRGGGREARVVGDDGVDRRL